MLSTCKLKKKAIVILVAAVLVVGLVVGLTVGFLLKKAKSEESQDWRDSAFVSESELGVYDSYAVATDAAPCAPMGKEILEKGGSAVDAAITTLLCMGLVNPESMGIGGGFLMTIYNRTEQSIHVLDARETAPSRATENMYDGNRTLSTIGALAAAIPGEIVGYETAHQRFGRLPWEDLFKGPIELCQKGVVVGDHMAKSLRENRDEILREPTMQIFVNNDTGDIYQPGDVVRYPQLAKTLEAISKNGASILYGGELGKKLVEDIQSMGGIIEEEDLFLYAPQYLSPLKVVLRDNLTLYTVPPPGSGALLAYIINILDEFSFKTNKEATLEEATLADHRVIEAFKFAYAKRMEMEDSDSPRMKELMNNLTSEEMAYETSRKINDNMTFNDPFYYGLVNFSTLRDHGTSHMSIVSKDGDAVSATSTINLYFGCLRRSVQTGIILNNEMDDFSSPNITNAFGVPPSPYNRIKPGRRPLSSMVPSIFVNDNGDVQLVVGGAGGTSIITGTALTSVRVLRFGDNVKQAIDAPRFHHQLFPNTVRKHTNYPQAKVEGLLKRGHVMDDRDLANVIQGIHRGSDGKLYANADFRKEGAVAGA